ncbi:hypothetical protein [Nocardia sp. NPDC058633]|uniref:hypothetical protein n=1 Tax=Nocardia sp. NPDC058633 TaxID=3346568 RepID=UPI00365BA692
MKPRKSTAILMAAWLSTFVVYLFVKPVDTAAEGPSTFLNAVPTWVSDKPDR